MRLMETKRINSDTVQRIFADEEGNIIIDRNQNLDNVLKHIEENRENAKGKDMIMVASLPMELIEKWRRDEGFEWFSASEKERKAKLNSPDNKIFRVYGGKV